MISFNTTAKQPVKGSVLRKHYTQPGYSLPVFIAKISCLALLLGLSFQGFAQKTFSGTGSWSQTARWSGGTLPGPTDAVTISVGATCTQDVALVTCASLTCTGTLNIGNNSVVVTGAVSSSGTISFGTNGTGTLNIGGSNTHSGTFTPGNSTVTYDGSGAQAVRGTTYYNLVFSNAGVKTLTTAPPIINSFTVNSGASVVAGASLITRSGSGTASFVINGYFSTTNVNGLSGGTSTAISSTGTTLTLGSSSTIDYNAIVAQVVTGRTDYANLSITGAAIKSISGTTTLSGTLTLNSGILAVGGNTLTVPGDVTGAGDITFGAGVLNVAGNFNNSGSLTCGTSTINYNGSSAQSVRAGTYYNVNFSNTGVKTFAGNIAVSAGAAMVIGSDAIVDGGANQITSTGATATVTINGTFKTAVAAGLNGLTTTAISSTNTAFSALPATSHIIFNAAGDQFITVRPQDSIYGSMTLTNGGTKTIAANYYMWGGCILTVDTGVDFEMGSRVLRRAGSTGTLTCNINGTIISRISTGFSGGATTINSVGTAINLGSRSVVWYGRTTGNQTLSSRSDYVRLRISGGPSFLRTMDGPVTVSDSIDIIEGFIAMGSNTLTINGAIGGPGFLSGNGSSNLIVNNAASAPTLNFIDTAAGLNNFTLNRSTGASLGGGVIVAGTLTLSSGALSLNGQTLNLRGSISYGTGTLTGSSTSTLVTSGSGDIGPITFTPGSEQLKSLTINRSSGTVSMGSSLTLATTGTLLFTNGLLAIGSNTLSINGNISGISASSCFSLNASSNLSIGGSGALSSSTIYFDQTTSGTTNRISSFTLNRASQTITLGNRLEVIGSVVPTAGTLASGGNLRLVSNASATGRIGTITAGVSSVSGNVNAQRYIPALARRWRFLSAPISNTTLEDWRGDIYITGAGTGSTPGTLNSNGFDATTSNKIGVYYYDETQPGSSSNGWTAQTNSTSSLSNVSLVPARGYRVFIRGDRSSLNRLMDLDFTQNAVTMDLTGNINAGDITMPVSYTNSGSTSNDGWCLLGNPYPSQYDWKAYWLAGNSGNSGTYYTNVDPSIYVYDPSSNSYFSYNAFSNTGTLTNGVIAQGQSFFAKATAASPAMTFKEIYKTSASGQALFKSGNDHSDELHITMELDSINFDQYILKLMPGTVAAHDLADIIKLDGQVNLSSYATDLVYHTVDARPELQAADTVLLKVSGTDGSYSFRVKQLPALPGKSYFLEDRYLSVLTPLSDSTTYAFSIANSIPQSTGNARFRLIIGNGSSSLPVTYLSFDAQKQEGTARLTWSTAAEINNRVFEIERSTDAGHFKTIGSVSAAGQSAPVHSYTFTDAQPVTNVLNYYRIRQLDNDGKQSYSGIRQLNFGEETASAQQSRVWPNPANEVINVSNAKGLVSVAELYNTDGLLKLRIALEGAASATLNTSGIGSGIYLLRVVHTNGSSESHKVLVMH